MGIISSVQKFLYNETVGTLPNVNGQTVPALLFANGTTNEKFGDIYLFSNFGIAGGSTISATSEITSNYVENNSKIQDHWAINPISYTLTGYIGEMVYKPAKNWTEGSIANTGTSLTEFLAPFGALGSKVSTATQTAINTVHQIEANYQKFSSYAQNLLSNINNLGSQKVQSKRNAMTIFQELIKLRDNRVLVDVYTPFGVLKNMAMVSISMSEDESSKYQCNVSVTLQEYKDVETFVREATEGEIKQLVKSEALSQQASEEKNGGLANMLKTDGNKTVLRSYLNY